MDKNSSKRYVVLDGMRGIAALIVGWLHVCEFFPVSPMPPYGVLAVDFFFCLSGFVLSRAYDARLRKDLVVGEFMAKRMIRLYPMLLIGIVLGSTLTIANAMAGSGLSPGILTVYVGAAFFLIPIGIAFNDQSFPVNGPMWSLFFEMIGGFIYARYAINARIRWILLVLAISACALAVSIWMAGGVGLLGVAGISAFVLGIPRVVYPILAGVLIHRLNILDYLPNIPPIVPAACLIFVLCAPIGYGVGYEIACVLIVLPLITMMGAKATTSVKAMAAAWDILGRLSYPFYLIHQPMIRLTSNLASRMHLGEGAIWGVAVASMVAASILSYTALVLYDEPVRRKLNATLFTRRKLAYG